MVWYLKRGVYMENYIKKQALRSPQPWGDGGKVHNWQNYVGENVRNLWDSLPDNVKIAIALDAYDSAMAAIFRGTIY